jgi:ribosome-binding protein aMBF1 (putative translation factor)
MKNLNFRQYLEQQLKDPKFKREWEKSEPAYQVTRELIKARIEKQFSQRQLAKAARTTQTVVSRIENMSVSPSVGLLSRLAASLGKKLEIRFS